MQIIRKGSTGLDVKKWQIFLRGLSEDSLVVVTGKFDDITEKETKIFQSKKGLNSDGIIGQKTFAYALQDGYPLMRDLTNDQYGPSWPPKPSLGSLSYLDHEKMFGKFSYISTPTYDNPEAITITSSNWLKNISYINVPQLTGIKGVPISLNIPFHVLLMPQLKKLFEDWQHNGLIQHIITWGGSWVPRYTRGSRTKLSNHAWGTAFDINVQWNQLGKQPALKGEIGSVRELVQIADQNGFYWGGHFHTRKDGMHFQAKTIIC